jgi:hypothetical protein
MLPPPASLPGDSHYCLLALLHSSQDAFTSVETNVDQLTVHDRKVGQKNLNIVSFIGVPPPPAPWRWAAFQLHGGMEQEFLSDLVLEAHDFKGRIGLVLPSGLRLRDGLEKSLVGFTDNEDARIRDEVEDWQERQRHQLRELIRRGRYNHAKTTAMLGALERVAHQPLLLAERGGVAEVRGIELQPGSKHTAFLAIQAPADAAVGDRFDFRLVQRRNGHALNGGCSYSIRILASCDQVANA